MNNLLDKIQQSKRYHFGIFFALLVFLSLLMMYLYQPLCPGDDFFFHYRRLQALMERLQDSPWLIYLDYSAIDGYGYFTKAFYSDFILVPFALIGNLTDSVFAYKALILVMTVLCGVFTCIFIDTVYKNTFAAVIGALLFTFSAYRLLDIYHRAAIGEAISFTFIPLVFLGLYHIIKGNYKKWYILTVGFSLLIFTHLISSVLMFVVILIFLAVYCKSLFKEPARIRYLILAGVATVIITAYYTFPMLEQMLSGTFYYRSRELMSKTQDAVMDFHWILWGMFKGFTIHEQAFIPGVGLPLTCGIALRLFVYEKSKELKSIDTGVITGLVFILACTPVFPWTVFPFSLLNFMQLPWRLFEFSSFFFAVAGGYYLSRVLRTNKRILFTGGVIIVLFAFMFANDSKIYHKYRCWCEITQEAALWNNYHLGGMEYVPEKVPSIEYLHQRGDSVKTIQGDSYISGFSRSRDTTSFDIDINNAGIVELPLIYYKGYAATLDRKDIPVTESEHGLVQVSVDRSGRVEAWYKGTLVQKAGFFITILSSIALIVFVFLQKRKYNE
jgi:hypothetical protein